MNPQPCSTSTRRLTTLAWSTLVLLGPALPTAQAQKVAEAAPAPGTITTIAGTGQLGFSGDGGPATQARLNHPIGVVVDAAGNIFFADGFNNRVRKVSPSGIITTVAGSGPTGRGNGGFSGDGGMATRARLNFPMALTLDGVGNLFIGDRDNSRVRKVSPDGIITTVAGNGQD